MTSTWNALTGLPSIFLRQDWLKFSLLHQYHNALGRLESTPSKKRAFLCPDAIFLNGNWIIIFFIMGRSSLGLTEDQRFGWGRYLLAGILMEGPEALRSINEVHHLEGSAVHWKTSECWPARLSQHTKRFWTNVRGLLNERLDEPSFNHLGPFSN